MSTTPTGTDDPPAHHESPELGEWPEPELTLADATDDDAPDVAGRTDHLPYGAVVAFDGSSPDAWIAVGRQCCIELPDTL